MANSKANGIQSLNKRPSSDKSPNITGKVNEFPCPHCGGLIVGDHASWGPKEARDGSGYYSMSFTFAQAAMQGAGPPGRQNGTGTGPRRSGTSSGPPRGSGGGPPREREPGDDDDDELPL
jgi:hypothetical protein